MEISKYKKDPNLLINAKIKKMVELESKAIPEMSKVNTIFDFINGVNRLEKYKERISLSLFRDLICLDFAKYIASNTRLELYSAYRMVKASINMKTAENLLNEYAVRVKDGVLFQLSEKDREEIASYFVVQINNGATELKLPKKYLK
ncbi:MAG: hypothetical protein NZ903_02930 [Candidatus Micrarchaeota archaeon]|nr:hypothetical protein [Candidatus Micrarchaeota archaeon]